VGEDGGGMPSAPDHLHPSATEGASPPLEVGGDGHPAGASFELSVHT